MGLLRRTPPKPSAPPLPGDWIDALQRAMHVDPSLRPNRDRPPLQLRTRQDDADDDVPPAEIDYDDIHLADAPEPPPPRPQPAERTDRSERAWLPPVSRVVIAPRAAPARAAAMDVGAPAAAEDLFQWFCRLSRMRRADPMPGAFDAEALRAEAERYLSALASTGALGQRWRDPLASLVDVVMLGAGLPLAGPWRLLGPSPADAAYSAAAEGSIADPTGLHDGTWSVHHAALSLVADLVPDGPALLEQLDAKLHAVAAAPDERICPGAYEGVFDHAIVRPVGRPLRAVAAAAVGLLLLAVAAAVLLNLRYVAQMRGSVDAVDRALRDLPRSTGSTGGQR